MPHAQLWLVRHGETEWSASGRHTSHTDVPLTERGRERAADLRTRLTGSTFDAVLTSPLGRARETCALAGFADQAEIDEDLHEWDYGSGEGLTTAEIRQVLPGWTVWTHDLPRSESVADVSDRADRVIARARAAGGRTIVFSHGHFSRVLGARWIDLPAADGARLRLDTAAVCVLGWERDCPVLVRWNDTGALPS
jgi:broad specificity phosphatase PhoE